MDTNEDFHCTVLCRHGPRCDRRVSGMCFDAHDVREVVWPYELDQEYNAKWLLGVDRFIGQVITPEQVFLVCVSCKLLEARFAQL